MPVRSPPLLSLPTRGRRLRRGEARRGAGEARVRPWRRAGQRRQLPAPLPSPPLPDPARGRPGEGGGGEGRRGAAMTTHGVAAAAPARLPSPPLPDLAGARPGQGGGGEARRGATTTTRGAAAAAVRLPSPPRFGRREAGAGRRQRRRGEAQGLSAAEAVSMAGVMAIRASSTSAAGHPGELRLSHRSPERTREIEQGLGRDWVEGDG
uniref:Uncharacterized protein n=1 Tax=Oryza sativa subsp. japonica TaxID=39947 RepID=Q8S5Q5_ORYSJ|nr:Hypothetical protein [Oryza sativa Japonica Group]